MIKCLAIDDEPLALKQLATYISKIPYLELVGECQSAHDAKTIMDREVIDAIFIDINMPDLNGMDFVRSLAAPPIVVFTTAYSEYAIDGYKVDAVDYLLKPFGLDDFQRAAMKVKKQYDLQNTQPVQISAPDEDEALFLKTDYKVVRVNISDIKYVEGMSEYLKIYLNDRKPLVVLLSMKKLEERLPHYFMRIHRSYIVNLKYIQEVNKNRVILDADTYLPIGDLYRTAFNEYIDSKFLGK
ncbi:MAG: response regulator transcription factor [Prevotella sp.]|jgi:Response regulator of the LytR/AlgR family|nr:response regulator transcription factor [Prevotella sp.]MBQ2333583.1 response regulator transcription factor [Prevotella sp.]MBQ2360066.1 response regulator transcription factor [Prevotella sp.]MBQ4029794.1 response regulator transcription factor [Prevotella sp.]MBQ5455540.1 response regulator transcription factor [Prevotella sp.]